MRSIASQELRPFGDNDPCTQACDGTSGRQRCGEDCEGERRIEATLPGKTIRMNGTYRNIAIAAGGVLAVAVAAQVLRSKGSRRQTTLAQTMTVRMHRDEAMRRLDDDTIITAVGCDGITIVRDFDDGRLVEWACADHPDESGRLALIAAPGGRGTELHVAMHGEKYRVKDVVRRMKMLLETGELATGGRQ
jgi:hypothetical protein